VKTLVSTQHDPSILPSDPLGEPIGDPPSGDSLRIGTQAGPWVLERELGRGGMGVVYEARHAKIGKRAALKVMRRDSQELDVNASRMQLEAQVVNAIGHPNIVDIFDVGVTDDGRPYIVMELLTGRSLKDCEPDPPSDVPAVAIGDALEILGQVSGALIAAHAAGVVHRDLKPENIFVADTASGAPRVVVLDWGIARMVHAGARHTLEGQLVGTPRYIAPEQARGEAVTAKTDVYALGVLAYELVLAQAPFDAESAAELMAMHLLVPARAPRLLWPEIPPRLGSLLEQMLAKAPDARPTMAEVHARLAQVAEELRAQPVPAPEAAPEPPPPRAPSRSEGDRSSPLRSPARRRAISTTTVIGSLALVGIAGAIAIATRGAQRPGHRVPSPTVPSTSPAAPPAPPLPAPPPRHDRPTASPASQPPVQPDLGAPHALLDDCSDPSVLRAGERWYMTCTGSHAGNVYPIYQSSDLEAWQRIGWIFPAGHKPAWATGNYWSPELHPTPDGIAAYFSMRVAGGRNAIGVATASTIAGPYTDRGAPLLAPEHGASDAHVLIDGDRRYLYFKDEGHPSAIAMQALAADGVTVQGEPTQVLVATREWEHDNVEAPWVVQAGGYFYLFYTGSQYCDPSYAIGVARARTPSGPFEKLPQPIVVGDADWLAPGHTSVTDGPSGERYLVYHAYRAAEGEPSCKATSEHNTHRHAKFAPLTFAHGWPRVAAPR
jgi:serine/threonine protein kinase